MNEKKTKREKKTVHVQLTTEAFEMLEQMMAATGVNRSSALELAIRKSCKPEEFV